MFGYSDEDGTEAAGYDGKLPAEEIAARVERITALTQELMAQRAEDRVGTEVTVLVEAAEDEDFECTGRAAHQAPEVDGECVVERGSGLDRRRDGAGGRRRHRRCGPHVAPREVCPGGQPSSPGGCAGRRRAVTRRGGRGARDRRRRPAAPPLLNIATC